MKYYVSVYENVVNFFFENEGRLITWAEIDSMNKIDVLNAYLLWEGIIGYTDIIADIMKN